MKRWSKSPPASRATGAARQTPPGARPDRDAGGPPIKSRVGRTEVCGNAGPRWMVAVCSAAPSTSQNPAYRRAHRRSGPLRGARRCCKAGCNARSAGSRCRGLSGVKVAGTPDPGFGGRRVGDHLNRAVATSPVSPSADRDDSSPVLVATGYGDAQYPIRVLAFCTAGLDSRGPFPCSPQLPLLP